jgi:hypothetical protein
MPAPTPPAGGGTPPRRGCIGCLTVVLGFFSGAMVAILVGVVVRYVTNAPTCPGVPICDWNQYAAVGGVLGLVTLPILTFWRLRQLTPGAGPSDRG